MVKSSWNGRQIKLKNKKLQARNVFEYGIVIQGNAVLACPKDTGRLAASITVKTRDKFNPSPHKGPTQPGDLIEKPNANNEALVGTNVDYATYQEYGTRKMSPQPYMRPAADITQGKAIQLAVRNGRMEFKDYFDEWARVIKK